MKKVKKGIVRNGLLLSMMAFYFSCGKDVFPPDYPDEISPERGLPSASLISRDAKERFSPFTVHPVPCSIYSLPCAVHPAPCTLSYVPLHLQQLGHEDRASCSASNRVVREPDKAAIKHLAGPNPSHDDRHAAPGIPVFARLRPVYLLANNDGRLRS